MDAIYEGIGLMLAAALGAFWRHKRNGHADLLSAATPATGSGPTVVQVSPAVDDTHAQIATLNRDLGRVEEKVERISADMVEDRKTLERCVAIVERNTGELTGQRTLLDRLVVDVREQPEKFVRRLEAEGIFTVKRREASPE